MFSFKKLFGDPAQKIMARSSQTVAAVNSFAVEYESLSDDAQKKKTALFRDRLAKGETEESILPEAFAVVKNACRRLFGLNTRTARQELLARAQTRLKATRHRARV